MEKFKRTRTKAHQASTRPTAATISSYQSTKGHRETSESRDQTTSDPDFFYPRIRFHHDPPLPICTCAMSVSVEVLSVSTAPGISNEGRQSAAPHLSICRASVSDGQLLTITRVPRATHARTIAGISVIEPASETQSK